MVLCSAGRKGELEPPATFGCSPFLLPVCCSSREVQGACLSECVLRQCSSERDGLLQVLSIGETVEEVNDSGFLSTVPTLRTQLLADDSMLQVRKIDGRTAAHDC